MLWKDALDKRRDKDMICGKLLKPVSCEFLHKRLYWVLVD